MLVSCHCVVAVSAAVSVHNTAEVVDNSFLLNIRNDKYDDAAATTTPTYSKLRSGSYLSTNDNNNINNNNNGKDDGELSSWHPHWNWPHWHGDPDDKKKDSCVAQSNCTSCLLYSTLCQWCDRDSKCHSSLSLSRCWTSGKCYTNEKCHRDEPEPVRHYAHRSVPSLAIWIVVGTASFILFCLTLGYLSIGSLNYAYRDVAKGITHQQHQQQQQEDTTTNNNNNTTQNEDVSEDELTQPLLIKGEHQVQQPIMEPHVHDTEDSLPATNVATIDNHNNNARSSEPSSSSSSSKIRSRCMKCIFGTCTFIYVVAIAVTVGTSYFVIYMFPQVPQLNICSDEVAWRSIIQGLESMQLEASFGILMSVYNPNRFGLLVKDFQGQFHHAGNYLGKYQIATTTFAPMSITDVTMTCTFSPEKWEVVKIAAQFYEKDLVLQVNAQGAVQLPHRTPPWPIHMGDITLNVTDFSMDDRHLCSCPKWKDTKIHKPQQDNTHHLFSTTTTTTTTTTAGATSMETTTIME